MNVTFDEGRLFYGLVIVLAISSITLGGKAVERLLKTEELKELAFRGKDL